MKISVFGLGYVGTVSAACLADRGHRVYGVDVSPLKVGLINDGKSPIVEQHIDTILAGVVERGDLTATTDAIEATKKSDISLICVGTPSRENGSLDLQYVHNVARDLGKALREKNSYHLAAMRSTMLPGTLETEVIPIIEKESGKRVGKDFGMCINPEFLREGTAVADYNCPPFTLIGACDEASGDLLASVYENIEAPIIRTDIRTAEMVKYACNAFHALKITFANEIGLFCKKLNIDSHKVMDVFTQDTQLNISPKYLKPGFAFGGSCLPKDLRAILHRSKALDLELPMLNSLLPSNNLHIDHSVRMIQRTGKKKIGILGLSFKTGTDDLRESAMVRLVETLIGKGYDLKIYDKHVSMARIVGANKYYIERVIPHISTLLVPDVDHLLNHADLLVIGNHGPESEPVLNRVNGKHQVIDLVRAANNPEQLNGKYEGVCW